jgi:hypothetical protein
MSGFSRLSPAQLADAAARQREGRPDKAVMTNEERRALGLMDRRQAAEHERLVQLPHARLADRVRGFDPDDTWLIDPAAEDGGDTAIWKAWRDAGHLARGCEGWSREAGASEVMCACGEVVALPQKAMA